MKLRRTIKPRESLLYLAPFISVVMILLGLLPLTTSFLLQPGIAVNVPISPFLLMPQQNPLIVSIVAVPEPTIFFSNQAVSSEDLGSQLEQRRGNTRTVIIKADQKVPLEVVMRVMNQIIQHGYSVVLATTPGHGS